MLNKMWIRIHRLLIVTLSVFCKLSQSQVNVPQNSDPCIDLAREAAYVPLQNFYPYYIYFTISLPTSRQLFRNLYTQSFTSASFTEYCRSYDNGRSEFNKCPETPLKIAVLSGYRLADFVCMNRLADFATYLPCLQSAYPGASDICRSRCQRYEQESNVFLEPRSQNDFLLAVENPHLSGDCRYLECIVSCRRPLFEQHCGRHAADLDWQALQVTAQSMQTLYDSMFTHRREFYELDNYRTDPINFRFSPPFPIECRKLSERYTGYYFNSGYMIEATPLVLVPVIMRLGLRIID